MQKFLAGFFFALSLLSAIGAIFAELLHTNSVACAVWMVIFGIVGVAIADETGKRR